MVAKLAEVNSLPSTEIEAVLANRNTQGGANQAGFNVSWHIVAPFERMGIVGLILRY